MGGILYVCSWKTSTVLIIMTRSDLTRNIKSCWQSLRLSGHKIRQNMRYREVMFWTPSDIPPLPILTIRVSSILRRQRNWSWRRRYMKPHRTWKTWEMMLVKLCPSQYGVSHWLCCWHYPWPCELHWDRAYQYIINTWCAPIGKHHPVAHEWWNSLVIFL